jgi:hypothetical protein
VPDRSDRIGGLLEDRQSIGDTAFASRVTANPTTSGLGNFNSDKYLHPDSATTPSHDTVSGSISQLVLIHALIAVSNSA